MSVLFHVFRHDPQVVQVPAGEYLFREGDLSNGKMYVLAVGKAEILLGDRLVEEAIPSTLVGEMGLIEPGSYRSASVRALTDCDFVAINETRFQHLVTDMPHFAMEVMRILVYRLRQSDARLEALASGVKELEADE